MKNCGLIATGVTIQENGRERVTLDLMATAEQ